MLGLPSTTEVHLRLPKKIFYEKLNPSTQIKDLFVTEIDSIEVVNSIKETTANFKTGDSVQEILLILLRPKEVQISQKIYKFIAQNNAHKLIFINSFTDEVSLVWDNRLITNKSLDNLRLIGKDLDEVWESLLSQIVFSEVRDGDIYKQIINYYRIDELEEKRVKFRERAFKEKQIVKRNYYIEQEKKIEQEIEALRGDR